MWKIEIFEKSSDLDLIWYMVADHDSVFIFTKFKMADPLWLPETSRKLKFSKNQAIWTEFGTWEVVG